MDLQPAVKMSPFRFIFKVSLIHVDGGATVLQEDPISKTQVQLVRYFSTQHCHTSRNGGRNHVAAHDRPARFLTYPIAPLSLFTPLNATLILKTPRGVQPFLNLDPGEFSKRGMQST